jgi:hypothetical protein
MVVKLKKKESQKKREDKIRRVSAKSKKIDWDKYFGKIDFPVDAHTYQRKLRDEWQ